MARRIFDYSKLRGKIKELFGCEREFAGAMNMSATTLSLILNNKAEFSQNDIKTACELLRIPPSKLNEYFFYERS
jgi:transcriptional regulator with XRE-family HTH domain